MDAPPLRADTPWQRLALLVAALRFVAIPVGLLLGGSFAIIVEDEALSSVLEGVIFIWPGIAFMATPGVIAYTALLELGRRFGWFGFPLVLAALPIVLFGFVLLEVPLMTSGSGGVTVAATLLTFGVIVVHYYKSRVF